MDLSTPVLINLISPTRAGSSLGLYYLWNVATTVILLNILVSLFSSAYQDVIDDAEAQYLAFFAGKTVNMIRAPVSTAAVAPLRADLSFRTTTFM